MQNSIRIDELKEKVYKKRKDLPRYAVLVTHEISIRIVWLMRNLDISPNWITAFTILLGVLASGFFTLSSPFAYLLGALILEAYYVFDAVDGQYARFKNKASVTGAYFDYISNHIVHSLVFLGMGIGLYRLSSLNLFLFAGFLASWGMLFMYGIHDVRHTVLGYAKPSTSAAAKKNTKDSLFKLIFKTLHKTCTYPPILNVITVTSIVTVILCLAGKDSELLLFKTVLIYYAVAVNAVWITKLAKAIMFKDLDTLQ